MLTNRYAHGPGVDEPLAWYSSGPTRWFVADRQGSIIIVDGASPTLLSYGPYGEPNAWSGPISERLSRFRYTGQTALPELQLYHYKARVYDPGIGRFLQTDPVGYEDDLNLYLYVGNDPLNRSDPTGRQTRYENMLMDRDMPPAASVEAPTVGEVLLGVEVGLIAADVLLGGPTGEGIVPAAGVRAIREGIEEGAEGAAGAASRSSRSERLAPDERAEGAHSTFRRDRGTGEVNHTATYEPNARNPTGFDEVSRTDVTGPADYNKVTGEDVPTPHVQGRGIPGGVRPARPDEIPRRAPF